VFSENSIWFDVGFAPRGSLMNDSGHRDEIARLHLSVGRASSGGLFLGGLPTLTLHFAAIEAHRALSPSNLYILRRSFSSVVDFLEFDSLTLIQSAQTSALDG